jgi:glycosyltransferase involved in cell wall biosynthesis
VRIAEIVSAHARNGAAVHAVALTRELVARQHDVTVICRPESWTARQIAGITDVVPSDLRRWPADELRRIARLLRERDIDVVHTHMSRAHFFGVLLTRFSGVPVVATAHNRVIQPHWMLNDHVIAVSAAVARFQRRWNLVRAHRITVVHNFVDPSDFGVDERERGLARAHLRSGDGTFLIAIVGSIFVEKGVHHAIDALPAVLARVSGARLAIVGGGPDDYIRALKRRADGLGVSRQITWAGESDDVRGVLAAADAVAVPSTEEAFPFACLEAMAAGRAVVATRVGGIPEIVVDGGTGTLVPRGRPDALAAALVALAEDPDRRIRFGEAGRQRVFAAFSPRTQIARIEGVLVKVVESIGRATEPGPPPTPAFDRRLSEFRTTELPCSAVVDLLPFTHAPDRVALYSDRMRRGDRFPPISVIRVAGRYVVADGHKRFNAHRALGADRIIVEVWPLRRWLRDQREQAVRNARKNARILKMSVTDPPGAWRLLYSTLLHWRRVATALAWWATRRWR